MSLISFHRVLIVTGIVFCFAFAGWELLRWWVAGSPAALVLGGTFIALGLLLTFYLRRLNRFLGYEKADEGDVGEGPRELGDADRR